MKCAACMSFDVHFGGSKVAVDSKSAVNRIVQSVVSALQDVPDKETLDVMDLDTRVVFHTVYDAMIVHEASFKRLMDPRDVDKTVSGCRRLSDSK